MDTASCTPSATTWYHVGAFTSNTAPSYLPSSFGTSGTGSNSPVGVRRTIRTTSSDPNPTSDGSDRLVRAFRNRGVARRAPQCGTETRPARSPRAASRTAHVRMNAGPTSDASSATTAIAPRATPFRCSGRMLDAMRGVEVRAHLERLFHDPLHERRGFGRVARAARLHRAEQRRLERRLVLLEIQRHLFIGDSLPQRTDEEPEHRRASRVRPRRHARRDDRHRAEPAHCISVGRDAGRRPAGCARTRTTPRIASFKRQRRRTSAMMPRRSVGTEARRRYSSMRALQAGS